MSGYLLDTNVVSELSKENPNEAVVRYLNAHDDLWISVIVVEELELGVQLLCGACNSLKGNRPQEYLMARLREMGM